MRTVLNDDGQELTLHDVWHVKVSASLHPRVMKIIDLTPHTIKLMEMPFSHLQPWYVISNLKFLAKVDGDEES